VEVLRFRGLQRELAEAREAAAAGNAPEAIRAYNAAIASSPESAFLYRELAAVERQNDDLDLAIEHYRKAVELEPGDATSLAAIAGILEERGDFDAALEAYEDALAVEPSTALEERRDALRARAELARLPGEYRAIETATSISRADLAALVGVRLAPVLQGREARDAGVVTDIRGNWAESWIMTTVRAGVIEPFANHTFQPRAVVRRVDLAQAVSRLLPRVATPTQLRAWEAARVRFSDVSPSHLAYPAASIAVASNVMRIGPDGDFDPSRMVTGPEAAEAIERLRAMANLPTSAANTPR
jgi:tetratricopeptide (TPR) repeat protein